MSPRAQKKPRQSAAKGHSPSTPRKPKAATAERKRPASSPRKAATAEPKRPATPSREPARQRKGRARELESSVRPRSAAELAAARERRAIEREPNPGAIRAAAKPKDGTRTFALLWGAQERTGRSGLTVRTIVQTAIEIADREGFEAISMRRLAEALEAGTMSLYTHVPGKAELTDLMIDAVYGELYNDADEPRNQPGNYRAGLRYIAERNRALYAAHPWLLDVPLQRPVLGPHACLKFEAELRVLEGIGLSDLEMDSVLSLLMMHVQGTARATLQEQRAQQATGMTEMEWWSAIIPLLERVKSDRFPVASRVGPAAGEAIQPATSPEYLYRFGLDVICETVTVLLSHKQPRSES